MSRRPWLTLGRLFALATLAVVLPVGATLLAFFASSQRAILARSEKLREQAAQQIDERLSLDLGVAAGALENVERAMRYAGLDASKAAAVQARLFSELLDHPTLSDLSLTHATLVGYDPNGTALLGPDDRWQVAACRVLPDAGGPIVTRQRLLRGGAFVSEVRRHEAGGSISSGILEPQQPSSDPTAHATFATTVSRREYGRAIWSDLSFSDLDAALPLEERRVVVTVQKAIEDVPGHFAGVVRVGLLARTIDSLPRLRASDIERVILCDSEGRLVARLDPRDRVDLVGDDLRVFPERTPPEIQSALMHPGRSGPFRAGDIDYLVTFRPLQNSQHWLVGVIAPEAAYTRELRTLRDRFLAAFVIVMAVVFGSGWLLLRQIHGALARVLDVTNRMRRFEFAPSAVAAPVREVADVMDGIERAKTSVRALGKYVSVDLVRQLYEANREPELGGQLTGISLMFTDIEGFTTLSERLEPRALAQALGRYLEAMTQGVSSTGGTVDKFIGDAVMAFWNAPNRCDDHADRACRAVLECMRRTRELYASDRWAGLPPLFTRFGVHTALVMVGHFGAPDRISYTALGDGVNLAARLEGLCKQYGLFSLVSEATVRATGNAFAFRLVDKVAVKGKHESVRVYELLGSAEECVDRMPMVRAYESALGAYFRRDFSGALRALATMDHDPPSRVLADRCKAMIIRPPTEDWDGVYVATSK